MSHTRRCCMLLLTVMLFACKSDHDELTHESVRRAAQQYYTLLAQGDVAQFVDGMADTDSLPEAYRSQLNDMVAQFARQQEKRGGIVRAVATADSLYESSAYVFLDLHYGDSTVEQIGVTMVMQGDKWKMK